MDVIQAPTTQQFASTDGTVFQTTFFSIGDWNMDTTATVAITHGITASKILGMMAMVRDDNDQLHTPLTPGTFQGPAEVDGYFYEGIPGTIYLTRRTGGGYDSVDYNSTGYNRGYLCIFHLP